MVTNVVIMGEIPNGLRIGISGPGRSRLFNQELMKAVEMAFAPKITLEEAEKLISMPKYYRVTAHTGYCGEELVDYIVTDLEDELTKFADDLVADCAAEWAPDFESEYEDYGYESPEDYEEAYYADCGCEIEEIDYETWVKETK